MTTRDVRFVSASTLSVTVSERAFSQLRYYKITPARFPRDKVLRRMVKIS